MSQTYSYFICLPNTKFLYSITLLFCICLVPGTLYGQEPNTLTKEKYIGLHLGGQSYLLNDEIGSNLNYSGGAFAVGLVYQTSDTNKKQTVNLQYARPNITNDFNDSQLEGILVLVDYSYQKKLLHVASIQSDLHLGPYIKFQGFDRTYNYERINGSKDTGEVFGSLGLGASLARDFGIKNHLVANASMPILSYIFSREFTGSFTDELLWANKLLDYNFDLSYQRKLADGWSFQASYGFRYYLAKRTNDVKYGSHLVLVGLLLNL